MRFLLFNLVKKSFVRNMSTISKAPVLYSHLTSPGSRAVLITAKYLDIDLEIREISTAKKEHLTPEFLKVNPQHTIPTLDDNGHIICDSHAIATYLCNKYQPTHHLYPQHPACRSLVDQRLYFDASILFPLYKKCVRKIKFNGAYQQAETDLNAFKDACELLNIFLGNGNEYLTGKHLSLADFFCAATITQMNTIVSIDYQNFGNIKAWIERLSKLPNFANLNSKPVNDFEPFIRAAIEENRKIAQK